ncbi:lysine--tRNA ligase [Candidatus Gottesmanbacteria bacterium CG11_big_fil_rev_8_21_14_0_20_37_11]|uniref:Lysine--tRNA ligase n=3 Tax=Candidatus Gottesmaniibacteriota TaxID=1752720 RepID=A0A2M7RR47_9BACT|nr:MAG: lysine--tRNA ligase [Candidatus Gottesmanbacteria bacterium CG1_02_37_22]PIP32604.1 MAG: lysine--tRNA ligase [Candidatus Gottesmanbacteria bacterium CG23_combo_of_CG06-09_8_20_14_all_37_19]PIR08676.1 MAG: lysine--tRNA ligase [Candidatus Gottesmanbacteria bacterium CG11_big_fil_rev_8_21_14_0_20_37_11]PIZ02555.1 MAG: lysine--tRNA ligase [Candidatus Gottesmanbacteria bacterium CG_4_10_14_0_8_um_filter_37_24]
MFWADRIAKDLKKTQHIDDMFTPSGYAHVGSLRGPVLHDVIYRVLSQNDKNTIYTYIFNDFDPIDGLPEELKVKFTPFMGYPLRLAPSPDGKERSFADFFAKDFKSVLTSLGVKAKYLSSWDMYHGGKFNKVIRTALDNVEKIQNIYSRVSGSKKKEKGWYPLQVICPECKKLGSTIVTGWDGKKVTFKCEENLVAWAIGCGFQGKISPFDGNAKLPWKVDWPAHWKVLGVTFEGAGKDHASRGGSYDIAFAQCEEVFDIPKPYYFPYEFFLLGGKKMGSSKGIGLKARDLTYILPPEIARFLIVRVIPNKALEFNPTGETIPNLFDEFDRCAKEFWKEGDPDLSRIFELSKVNDTYKHQMFLPRFKDVVNYQQNHSVDLYNKFREIKGESLNQKEQAVLNQRIKYAKIWIADYAPDEYVFRMTENIPGIVENFNSAQKQYLSKVSGILSAASDDIKPEDLQQKLYELTKELSIPAKQAFEALYISLIGKTHGPKAGWFLLSQDKNFILKRLKDVQSYKHRKETVLYRYQTLDRPDLFSIDKEVKKRFPSINVGIAIIKEVVITKDNVNIAREIDEFSSSITNLDVQQIGEYKEISSYRRIYKETGVDWHKRRSSPEALLRRIAQGKGVARVNSIVDAYNLIVMKYRVSAGAFNFDEIKFPTILRFAHLDDKIHMIGEDKPTTYNEGEIAYFDQIDGYNIDFNYRDSVRTSVDENSRNLWINTEGVYDITREQIENTLEKTIEIIIKHFGGKVEFAGIVTAKNKL